MQNPAQGASSTTKKRKRTPSPSPLAPQHPVNDETNSGAAPNAAACNRGVAHSGAQHRGGRGDGGGEQAAPRAADNGSRPAKRARPNSGSSGESLRGPAATATSAATTLHESDDEDEDENEGDYEDEAEAEADAERDTSHGLGAEGSDQGEADGDEEEQRNVASPTPQPRRTAAATTATSGRRQTQPQASSSRIPGPVTLENGELFFRSRREQNDWENRRIAETEARADVAARTVAAMEAQAIRERRAQAKAFADKKKHLRERLRDGDLPEGLADDLLDAEEDAMGRMHGHGHRRPRGRSTTAAMHVDMDTEEDPMLTSRVSKGARRVAGILGDTLTEKDIQDQMDADEEEGLIWFYVPPQEIIDMQIKLGKEPDNQSECFACNIGGDESIKEYKVMKRMWMSRRGKVKKVKRALHIHKYYMAVVMPTINRLNENMHGSKQDNLQPWSASSIYYHFTTGHRNDPETFLEEAIDATLSKLRFIVSNGLYMQNSRNPNDIRISKRGDDMMQSNIKLLMQLYNCKPQNMFMYDDSNAHGNHGTALEAFTPDMSFKVPRSSGMGRRGGGNPGQLPMSTFFSPSPSPGSSNDGGGGGGGGSGNGFRSASMSLPLD